MPSGNILPPLRPARSPPQTGTADPRASIPFTLELEENRHSQLCRERHLSLMNHMRTLWSHIFTTDRYHRSIHKNGRLFRTAQQSQLDSIERRQNGIEQRQKDIERKLIDVETQKDSKRSEMTSPTASAPNSPVTPAAMLDWEIMDGKAPMDS